MLRYRYGGCLVVMLHNKYKPHCHESLVDGVLPAVQCSGLLSGSKTNCSLVTAVQTLKHSCTHAHASPTEGSARLCNPLRTMPL